MKTSVLNESKTDALEKLVPESQLDRQVWRMILNDSLDLLADNGWIESEVDDVLVVLSREGEGHIKLPLIIAGEAEILELPVWVCMHEQWDGQRVSRRLVDITYHASCGHVSLGTMIEKYLHLVRPVVASIGDTDFRM